MKKKLLSIICAICTICMLLPMTISAEGTVPTYYRDYATGNEIQVSATPVTENMAWSDGWYVVDRDVNLNNELVDFNADVHLILADGCTLTVGGIVVHNNLVIYGQSQGTGKLFAQATDSAGIRNVENGTLTINGGTIVSQSSGSGVGIHLGTYSSNSITINGGNVTATGGSVGIGVEDRESSEGAITINGGMVHATGSSFGINASPGGYFYTGENGHAVIFINNYINHRNNFDADLAKWGGIIFCNQYGEVYGSEVTLKDNVTIPEGYNLLIGSGKKLIVPEGVTLTNNGSIFVDGTFEGTADNLYYPLNVTILSKGCSYSPYTHNGKTYGKAGSEIQISTPSLGEKQYCVFTVTGTDINEEKITKYTSPSITMPYAAIDLVFEIKEYFYVAFWRSGGTFINVSLKKYLDFIDTDDPDKSVYLYPLNENGGSYILPTSEQITKPGYVFAGWYNHDDPTDGPYTEITNWSGFREVYAKWEPATYTVSLNANGGTINNGNVEEYTYAQGATLPTDVTKDGYTFAGWYDNKELSGSPVTEISTTDMDTKTYWAKWEDIEKPVIKGLEEGKTYCDTIQFEVSDNDGISSVTVNGDLLTPDSNGKYSLEKGKGTVTVVVKDKANNETSVTVTVKDGHSLEHFDAKEASVSETGTKEYWQCDDCHKYFTDEEATNEITDLEAWKTSEGLISKTSPEIIKGKGQSVTQGTKKALSFTSNASIDDFICVKLDGEKLDSSKYTVKSGSIVVTLKSDFVSTLKAGKHTISIVSESGEATTEFEVVKKEAVKDSNKTNTGLIGNAGLWISMMVSSLDALLIGFVLKRKNRK